MAMNFSGPSISDLVRGRGDTMCHKCGKVFTHGDESPWEAACPHDAIPARPAVPAKPSILHRDKWRMYRQIIMEAYAGTPFRVSAHWAAGMAVYAGSSGVPILPAGDSVGGKDMQEAWVNAAKVVMNNNPEAFRRVLLIHEMASSTIAVFEYDELKGEDDEPVSEGNTEGARD